MSGNFQIKKREVLVSIVIIAIMLIAGLLIHTKISNRIMEKQQKYETASMIEDEDLFSYGMRTNIGNAFVYGELKAADTVTYSEIPGEYTYIKKVKEEYTMHTRTVTYTDGNGKTHTKVETYWEWDKVGEKSKSAEKIEFCGTVFDIYKIMIPDSSYVTTVKQSSHVRYKYYGVGTEFVGTIFTELSDNTISNGSHFYNNMTIEETKKYLESGGALIIFWFLWIIFIGLVVFGFYYLDNKWLD